MTVKLDNALERLARDPSASLDLAEVALLLARDESPFLDVDAHLCELDAMAREVKPYMHGHLAHQVQGLCRYLFHEMGFRANQRDYYDPRNSYFNMVLERRLGIPITLSAVTIAVGTRAGLTLAGIGLPGHFIVKATDPRQEILIDPFGGGRILSHGDCENLVRQATGLDFESASLSLEAIPLGLIIQRMLNNLRAIYLKTQDWTRSIRTLERLRQLKPQDVVVRRDLGLCQVRLGQPGKAVDHLRGYLAEAADAEDTEAIQATLRHAEATLAQWN
ncbi:MAG: tetratricopeptide repeat protein [Planctomycetes bacterium]|nr:tetratricopeptide repeat protein [Planctomycetota bacterium]